MENIFSYNHLTDEEKSAIKKHKLLESIENSFYDTTNLGDILITVYDNLVEYIKTLNYPPAEEENILSTELPVHYKGSEDVIDFVKNNTLTNEFVTTMMFNILKYATRLGKKDSISKDARKIYTYIYRLALVVKGQEWAEWNLELEKNTK